MESGQFCFYVFADVRSSFTSLYSAATSFHFPLEANIFIKIRNKYAGLLLNIDTIIFKQLYIFKISLSNV